MDFRDDPVSKRSFSKDLSIITLRPMDDYCITIIIIFIVIIIRIIITTVILVR